MAEKNIWEWAGNFAEGFGIPGVKPGVRPIFVGDVEIGAWSSDDDLCKGRVFIQEKYRDVPPEQWWTKDDFWRDVPVSQFCASVGLQPAWMDNKAFEEAKAAAPAGAGVLNVGPNVVRDVVQDFGKGMTLTKWLLIGGVAVVGLYFLTRDRPRYYH